MLYTTTRPSAHHAYLANNSYIKALDVVCRYILYTVNDTIITIALLRFFLIHWHTCLQSYLQIQGGPRSYYGKALLYDFDNLWVKPVYNNHLMGYFSAFWSSSRWPRAT